MKIMTILGTRPELIRLSLIVNKLDELAERHTIVHTGQNFTASLSTIFLQQLGIREPDYLLGDRQQTLGGQLAAMFSQLERILDREKPDKVLVLGDTNSGLSAILAERMGIPVFHMEAGNRCFDLDVPEEKNRRVIDAIASVNLPYTPQSGENLIREGIPPHRIVVTGNPIHEVLNRFRNEIEQSSILEDCRLQLNRYFLLTLHRAENVDHPSRLREIFKGINMVAEAYGMRIVCSLHPRTASRLKGSRIKPHPLVEMYEPFGFFDFVQLEKNAYCVLTDSGTVQEECCLFHIPTVTVRQTTERPETIACGSNMLSGINANRLLNCVRVMTNRPRTWDYPAGYEPLDVSDKIIKILLGGMRHVC